MKNFAKKLKITTATLAAILAVGTIGIGAYAANPTYKYTFPTISAPEKGGTVFSDGAEKLSNEPHEAKVFAATGFVTDTSFLYMAVYRSPSVGYTVTSSYKLTKLGTDFVLPYTTERGAGSINYLGASSGYYAANVAGSWEP